MIIEAGLVCFYFSLCRLILELIIVFIPEIIFCCHECRFIFFNWQNLKLNPVGVLYIGSSKKESACESRVILEMDEMVGRP